uniref:Uncharacterized protein n=1 Tax=Arundo donax TaxID=35708 RepID=A0A0A9AC11_ARUDO
MLRSQFVNIYFIIHGLQERSVFVQTWCFLMHAVFLSLSVMVGLFPVMYLL